MDVYCPNCSDNTEADMEVEVLDTQINRDDYMVETRVLVQVFCKQCNSILLEKDEWYE